MKDYTVLEPPRKWGKDNIYSVIFEEDKSEPVDWFEPSVIPITGQKYRGTVEEYSTQSGGIRRRFVTQEAQSRDEQRQLEINTSWAITNALQICRDNTKDEIKECAAMLLEIKKELMS